MSHELILDEVCLVTVYLWIHKHHSKNEPCGEFDIFSIRSDGIRWEFLDWLFDKQNQVEIIDTLISADVPMEKPVHVCIKPAAEDSGWNIGLIEWVEVDTGILALQPNDSEEGET